MANNPQQSERGIASTRGSGFVVMMTGAAGALPAGCTKRGCVFVLSSAGAGPGKGRGKMLIRAVSLFGSMPGGFGNGWRSGDSATEAGMIFGGNRGAGVRVGSTIRVVSRFSVLGEETVSFFGSVMGGPTRPEHLTNARRLSLLISVGTARCAVRGR
jgi:hypothetical protein